MNPNSALVWLPAIEKAGLPTPKTGVVPYSHHDCLPLFDGENAPEFDRLLAEVQRVAAEIGYPLFVRTDLASAKHSGPRAFRANAQLNVAQCLIDTIEDNEMKFWLEREGPQAFLIRQYLNLTHNFTAFRGTPIAREFRLFATGDGIVCHHPYWPECAIDDHVDDGAVGWQVKLAEMNEFPACMDRLREMAIAAAGALGGAWSVDFAQDIDGKWWLLDMATAAQSWHWPGCEMEGACQ